MSAWGGEPTEGDPVNPAHYAGPVHLVCGRPIECIDVVRELPFNLGAAVKYVWRLGKKDDAIQELSKAIWYLEDERQRLLRQRE